MEPTMDASALASALRKGQKKYELFKDGLAMAEMLEAAESRMREAERCAVDAERRLDEAHTALRDVGAAIEAQRQTKITEAMLAEERLERSLAERRDEAGAEHARLLALIEQAHAEHAVIAEQVVKARAAAEREMADLRARVIALKDQLEAYKLRAERA